jgi:phosphoserine phosphatase
LNERTDVDYNKFVSSINSKKRVINCIENTSFSVKILATAAPSIYAKIIAENESFDVCIGTDSPFGNYTEEFENSKEVKRKNVLNYLKTHNLDVIDMFITDHIDDLPLLKEANQNFIVNPDENFVKTLKQNSISFEVIP